MPGAHNKGNGSQLAAGKHSSSEGKSGGEEDLGRSQEELSRNPRWNQIQWCERFGTRGKDDGNGFPSLLLFELYSLEHFPEQYQSNQEFLRVTLRSLTYCFKPTPPLFRSPAGVVGLSIGFASLTSPIASLFYP